MDPNAVLKQIHEWLVNDMRHPGPADPEVDFWCHDLWLWLEHGGFAPEWERYPLGASYYRCRALHEPYTAAEMAAWER